VIWEGRCFVQRSFPFSFSEKASMSRCFSFRRLSTHASAILVALAIAFAPNAKAFTIDFEHDFGEPGNLLPDFYSTPFGDVQFINGVVLANPLSPETQMASQVPGAVADDGSTVFSFIVWASVAEVEVRLTLVNPNGEDIFVQYFETSFGDEQQDLGAFVPAEGTSFLVLEETLGPGADFYGASFDFENRCQTDSEVPFCTTNWGIDSIEIVPEPSTALLLAFGLTGLAVGGRRAKPYPRFAHNKQPGATAMPAGKATARPRRRRSDRAPLRALDRGRRLPQADARRVGRGPGGSARATGARK
jgi:hypothetical protein